MTLPFKLLSQPTADTTAQTQKDTRALATNEALQRLKDSGAMNLQRQKGMDARQNTLLGMGINPTQQGLRSGTFSPQVVDQIRQFYDANQVGKRADAIAAAVKGGVRLPPQDGPISLRSPLPDFRTGYNLPGVDANLALPKVESTTKDKVRLTVDPRTNKIVGTTAEKTITQGQKTTNKGRSVQRIADKHIATVARALKLSPDQLSGRIVEREGKFYVEYGPKGNRQGRELTPEILRSLPQGIF